MTGPGGYDVDTCGTIFQPAMEGMVSRKKQAQGSLGERPGRGSGSHRGGTGESERREMRAEPDPERPDKHAGTARQPWGLRGGGEAGVHACGGGQGVTGGGTRPTETQSWAVLAGGPQPGRPQARLKAGVSVPGPLLFPSHL